MLATEEPLQEPRVTYIGIEEKEKVFKAQRGSE